MVRMTVRKTFAKSLAAASHARVEEGRSQSSHSPRGVEGTRTRKKGSAAANSEESERGQVKVISVTIIVHKQGARQNHEARRRFLYRHGRIGQSCIGLFGDDIAVGIRRRP